MRVLTLALSLACATAQAYVPTVEALFRHGANPDVTTNGLVLSASISGYNPYAEKTEAAAKQLWVKWIYNVTPQGKLRLTQLLYSAAAMTEASLLDKVYIGDLTPRSFTANAAERGAFISLLNSQLINDGSFMVDFLQQMGIHVKLNSEIVNQEKVSLLHRHRLWLKNSRGGRAASEESPLAPSAPAERERVSKVMGSPMFLDTQQVSLTRFHGEPAWHISADGFEAYVDDAQREVRQLTLRRPGGDVEIVCRDAMLLNGTHRMPRQYIVKNGQDQYFQVNVLSLRHFSEGPNDFLTRLRRYDQLLGHKQEAIEKPGFLF